MGVTLGQEYNSGIIKGYLDLKIGAYIGSKWKLLSFLNNTGEVISFGLNGDKNWAYTLDGGTTWLDLDTSIAGAANTTYNIYFQFDLDNGTVTLYFNNVLYLNAKQVNVKSISCFQTMTNGKGTGDSARVVTLDNIAIVKED